MRSSVIRRLKSREQRELWSQAMANAAALTDPRGTPMDPGIVESVTALQLAGFGTAGSCEGHLDKGCATAWVQLAIHGLEESERTFAALPKGDVQRKAIARTHAERVAEEGERMNALLADFYQSRLVVPGFRLVTRPLPSDLDESSVRSMIRPSVPPSDIRFVADAPWGLLLYSGFRLEVEGSNGFDEKDRVGRILPMLTARREMQAFVGFLIEREIIPTLQARIESGLVGESIVRQASLDGR